ncbi:hypothetical protein [Priestia megaterium]|uniref:hypothetical protein n=1 Tax=Priestia megaterium TaxID=1404 RepID=UPI0036DA050B
MYESEPNNDFKIVDTLLNERVTFGQFEDTLDIDFYKVNVSGKGTLLVTVGTDTTSNIDLLFLAIEYQDHGYLEYLGSEYDDSVLESLWNKGDKERAKLCTKENGFSSSL